MDRNTARYFNPRSREGSDQLSQATYQAQKYFNPRSREGSDMLRDLTLVEVLISIHAPVKGATIE